MKSMTGYGYTEHQDDERYIAVELKCYNNRYRDIGVNIPAYLGPLEPRIREFLAARIERGKADISVRYRSLTERLRFSVDEATIREFADVLRTIAGVAGVDGSVTLSDLLTMEDLVKAERSVDVDAVWQTLHPVLVRVFEDFEQAREREGAETLADVSAKLEVIETCLVAFKEQSGLLEEHITGTVRSRFLQAVGDRVEEDRILAEIGSLLVKFSIDEEVARLKGHVQAFRSGLRSEGPVGKRLDFLCQEIHREINTIGSKSPLYEINRRVIDAKDALEKVREQLRNVE